MKTALLLLLLLAGATLAEATDLANRVLAEINLARTQPQRYSAIIAANIPNMRDGSVKRAAREAVQTLQKMQPLHPLTSSSGLTEAAAGHVAATGARGLRGHAGADGSSPWERMDRYGRRFGTAAENISYGLREPRAIVAALLIDAGVFSRGHRKNLLNPDLRHVGIAYGPHAHYGAMCVIDLAAWFSDQPRRDIAAAAGP